MIRCFVCGHEMGEDEPLFPMPVYDLDLENKKVVKTLGHFMCWECFSTIAGGMNLAIYTLRHRHIAENRGEATKEETK